MTKYTIQASVSGIKLAFLIAPLSLLLLATLPASAPVMGADVATSDNPAPLKPTPESAIPPAAEEENDIDIVIGGQPTKGRVVLPPTETKFKIKLAATKEIVELNWSILDEYERKRVQKLYGMNVNKDTPGFGDPITGVKLTLVSGKFIEGLPIPDRDRPNMKALRTATAPLLMISIHDIKSEEPYLANESDFYSTIELYDKRMLEKPPGTTDAGAHLAMARWAAGITLYGKAIEHLEQAKIIDPRTDERNADFRAELIRLHTNQQSSDLFNTMIREMRAGDFLSALDRLESLDRTFKNSDLKSRWDAMRPQIEVGSKTEINKKIVTLSYRIANELVEKKLAQKIRVDDKGYPVDAIPGKQVSTRTNIFRGVLVAIGGNTVDNTSMPDEYEVKEGIAKPGVPVVAAPKSGPGADDVTLKMGDSTITIAGKEILSIVDVDLSVSSKTAIPTYDQLKEYVTGLKDAEGLKQQMCKRISRLVKLPTKDVEKIFDGRLEKEGKYENGQLSMTNNYANLHDVFWGAGSWLRPGSKPSKYVKFQNNNNPRGSSANRYGRNGNNNQNPQNQQAQQDEETAEETDDPAIWWKSQEHDTQLGVLKAMMAEKVFKAFNVINKGCPNCNGNGKIVVTVTGGNQGDQRCPVCRGIGVLFRITYH